MKANRRPYWALSCSGVIRLYWSLKDALVEALDNHRIAGVWFSLEHPTFGTHVGMFTVRQALSLMQGFMILGSHELANSQCLPTFWQTRIDPLFIAVGFPVANKL